MQKIILIVFAVFLGYSYSHAQDGYIVEPSPTGGAYIMYTIQKGDNLTNIARNSGINLNDLLAANPSYSKTTVIHPNEQILIPLTIQQILSQDRSVDNSYVPLYYQIKPKEGLYRISLKFNRVPIPVLVKWNSIDSEDLIIKGRYLVIGYLKSDETNNGISGRVFASNIKTSTGPTNTVSEAAKMRATQNNANRSTTNKTNESYAQNNRQNNSFSSTGNNQTNNNAPNSNNSTLSSNNNTVITPSSTPKKDTMSATANILSSDSVDGEGFFKPLFLARQNEGQQFKTGDLMSGVFQNESGYTDKRYYALMVGVPVGQVIKITAPSTQKSIYVKILGPLPENLRIKKIDICISSASADQLGMKGESFIVQCLF